MKKLLILLLTCIVTFSCKKEEPADVEKIKLDPYTTITLNGVASSPLASTKAQFEPPYTIQTVVEYARDMQITTPQFTGSRGYYGKDIEAGKLMIGEQGEVIEETPAGVYKLGWLVTFGLTDVLCRTALKKDNPDEWWKDGDGSISEGTGPSGYDTIAYVPNAVIRKAEADIKVAFDAGNYEECLRLFDEAYTFIPTTGAEWRKLKADGVE